MKHYSKIWKENFLFENFKEKIEKAKNSLISSNKIDDLAFEIDRPMCDKGVLFKGESLFGQYLKYKITKSEEIIGFLECFIDDKKTYINIYTSPVGR